MLYPSLLSDARFRTLTKVSEQRSDNMARSLVDILYRL